MRLYEARVLIAGVWVHLSALKNGWVAVDYWTRDGRDNAKSMTIDCRDAFRTKAIEIIETVTGAPARQWGTESEIDELRSILEQVDS